MTTNCNLILQNIADYAVLLMDNNGVINFSNPAITAITGFSVVELVNQPFSILYTAKDQQNDRLSDELEQALKVGSYHTESKRAKKDGSTFWAEIALSPIRKENKEVIGFTCLLKDRTNQMQLAQALKASEERHRLMIELVKDYAIIMLDTNGYILNWNEGAQYIKGYRTGEIIGKHFSIFYTQEDQANERPQKELQAAIKSGKYEDEGWRVRKNGSLFWAHVLITPLYSEYNELVGFSKVTHDRTEKKIAEEALRQSEERYRLLVEQVTDYGIFMLDEKGRIISWNEGARRIKGYEAAEIIGKHFSIFYNDEDRLNNKPANELIIARRVGKYEEEGWRVRKDGTTFWANVVITAVYNKEGILVGFSKVTRDLTERKESERALKESNDRYRAAAEELKQTNFELQYANKELEQFTSIVSHDLQEPIRTIKSFLQLIEMKLPAESKEDLKNYIRKAITAGDRMRELIRNLLHYSQLDKDEVNREEIVVEEMIAEVLQNLKAAIDTSKAKIVIDSRVTTVKADRVQLVQLLQNLLSNALKFVSDTTPEVCIKCYMDGNRCMFAVSDNGIGIEENDLGKVFDIFRRLNTKKDYPGTGVGLAICKKIVDRHRGKIWPESKPGKGTTFYFTIASEKEAILSI